MATENYSKVEDNIRLEAETAYYSYTQALQKVRLTGSSLQKAKESERLAMEKYYWCDKIALVLNIIK